MNTDAAMKKRHDAMIRFLKKLCRDSDAYEGGRTDQCEENYQKAQKFIAEATGKETP